MMLVSELTVEAFEAIIEKHVDTKIDRLKDELHIILEGKFAQLENRITNLENRFTQLEGRVTNLESYMLASERRMKDYVTSWTEAYKSHLEEFHGLTPPSPRT